MLFNIIFLLITTTNAKQLWSTKGNYKQWIATVYDNYDCDTITNKVNVITRNHASNRRLLSEEIPFVDELNGPLDCFILFEGNEETAKQVSDMMSIEDVSENEETVIESTPWHLDRIDQPKLPLDNQRFSNHFKGSGQRIYVIDTGIKHSHKDFTKRVKHTESFIKGEKKTDLNGHGTFCASLAAGEKYGVAKKANIYGVKVLSSTGGGSTYGVIKGVQWAVKHAGSITSVLSMSLGGGKNSAMNKAVEDASTKHIVVVAAGNSNADACNYSPAGAGGSARNKHSVITVGSTDSSDHRSSFSSYGACVDIFAPGSKIEGTFIGPKTTTMSGTSMATPIVAGVAALLLEKYDGEKNNAIDELFAIAKGNVLRDIDSKTPNLLVQSPTKIEKPISPTKKPTFGPSPSPVKLVVTKTKKVIDFKASKFGPSIMPGDSVISSGIVSATTNLCKSGTNFPNFKDKIVMVNRGNCEFQDKVIEAQRNGAKALIIVNYNSDGPTNPECRGKCSDVKIPSCMVSRIDGKNLINKSVTWGSYDEGKKSKKRCRRKGKRKCNRNPNCYWDGKRCH